MANNQSLEFYVRTLKSRHKEFVNSVSAVIHSFGLVDSSSLSDSIDKALPATRALKSALSQEDCPSWLESIECELVIARANIGDPGTTDHLLNVLLQSLPIVRKQVHPTKAYLAW